MSSSIIRAGPGVHNTQQNNPSCAKIAIFRMVAHIFQSHITHLPDGQTIRGAIWLSINLPRQEYGVERTRNIRHAKRGLLIIGVVSSVDQAISVYLVACLKLRMRRLRHTRGQTQSRCETDKLLHHPPMI